LTPVAKFSQADQMVGQFGLMRIRFHRSVPVIDEASGRLYP